MVSDKISIPFFDSTLKKIKCFFYKYQHLISDFPGVTL